MNVIMIDDERLALMHLEKMLRQFPEVSIVGSCKDPQQGIDLVEKLKPDVVFLDIHMPEVSGLQIAEMLQERGSAVQIVFVTAHDNHAIEAFEYNAIDYILKPLQQERLAKTMQRLSKLLGSKPSEEEALPPAQAFVRTLPSLAFEGMDNSSETFKWRTAKSQELFAYLLHHRGQLVRKDALLDLLWPELDEKRGMTHLYTTVYQARQQLKRTGLPIMIRNAGLEEGYVLDLNGVLVDADEWERLIALSENEEVASPASARRLLDLYRGEYLGDYDYLWAESERQRLRMVWLGYLKRQAEYEESKGMEAAAIVSYHRIQQQHPYDEHSYFALMKLYDRLGDRNAVEEQYAALCKVLHEELAIAPHASIIQWHRTWARRGERLLRLP
ncbi:Two-component response regulator, SAPR family, consists of REC, wHTH and BTAD domains [Paenibacillus sp. UNCCL117]|uniref:response regulator n=1 Tax=unclassified Paenibacillus TaxID=185978 RepID=UPI000880B90D|nr:MULTISPECIES: response regulator [unclassified Paenibacillus]SDD14300.1 Two-component response regulator, SAPR family, consists of REC, wHTH and BTAD domains [Paenibacillus sp. cl123]SFW34193.1 Two-component response regulator, SAPR family, consists of REC, wHTH and BTAD domains [Paenibacillus sp. UNCCL117]